VPSDVTHRFDSTLAQFVQRHFLWLLVACYVLAAFWPAHGLAMRLWQWKPAALGSVALPVPQFLLAVMLFSAALLTDVGHLRIVFDHPYVLAAALLAVWLGPVLLVLVAGLVVPWAIDVNTRSGLLVGLALVATMPVANSSVAWAQHVGGNLGLSIALVVVSILLSPWVTPQLLTLLGMSLSEGERLYCAALVNQFSGLFFIGWVILPTLAGFLCRFAFSPVRIAAAKSWVNLVSASALLLLNYMNCALALPQIRQSPVSLLVATALLATMLSVVGLCAGWLITWLMRLKPETRSAMMFGLSMKHTGLALILAGTVLSGAPIATLMIVLATLMQHLLAGVVQPWMNSVSSPS